MLQFVDLDVIPAQIELSIYEPPYVYLFTDILQFTEFAISPPVDIAV
jgi:hypothetical protein